MPGCCCKSKSKTPDDLDQELIQKLQKAFENALQHPTLEDFFGTYEIADERHPSASLSIKRENVMEDHATQGLVGDGTGLKGRSIHYPAKSHQTLTKCIAEQEAKNVHAIGTVDPDRLKELCQIYAHGDEYPIVGVVQVPTDCAVTKLNKNGKPRNPWYFRFIQKPGYRFVLHKNATIKFIPMVDDPSFDEALRKQGKWKCLYGLHKILHQIALARMDSKTLGQMVVNIVHAQKYGCFCFGLLCKDEASGKIYFRRWNRWHKDLDFFYDAVSEKESGEAKGHSAKEAERSRSSTISL